MKSTPHSYRRMGIHAWILALLLLIAIIASSCATSRRPKDPCKERRGMSGYGYGWLKNKQTQEVFILDSNCHVITSFKDGRNIIHSKQTF